MFTSFLKCVFKNISIFFISFIFFVLLFENTDLISKNHSSISVPKESLVDIYSKTNPYNTKIKPETNTRVTSEDIDDQKATFIKGETKSTTRKQEQKISIFLPILLYHYVDEDKDPNDTLRKKLTVSPYIFEEQMRTLVREGYTTVTLYDLVEALEDNSTLPEKSFILTFDDGYEDLYTNVFPILKRYNLKATSFLILNSVNLKQNLKTWQIYELYYSGLVDFGAHSISHSNLTAMSPEMMKKEIVDSKYNLESTLNIPLDFFAYPGGRYNKQAIEFVKKGSFKAAVSTDIGAEHTPQTQFKLKRIKPGRISGESLLKLLGS